METWGREVAIIRSDETLKRSPFHLSESQKLFDKVVTRLRSFNIPVRLDILKSRQVYASTYFAHLSNRDAFLSPEPVRHTICSYQWASTKDIMWMLDLSTKNYPEGINGRKTSFNHSAPYELRYEDTGAYIDSLTGEKADPGRGGNRQFLHCSEVAFYRQPKELMLALLQSVPEQPNTTIVRETTAKGYDSYFYPRWQDAIDRASDLCRRYGARDVWDLIFNETGWGEKHNKPRGYWPGGYLPIFIPWTMMRKYRHNPEAEEITPESLTKTERTIMESRGLDLWQMSWRRMTIRDKFGGSRIYYDEDEAILDFQQEYPLTPEEAFKSTGRTVIKKTIVTVGRTFSDKVARERHMVRNVERPRIEKAVIEWVKGKEPRYNPHHDCTNIEELHAIARRNESGRLHIYAAPYRYPEHLTATWWHRYVIGADIAEGLAQRDYSVAYVLDRVNWQFVAMYRGHPTGLQFSEILAQMGYYYDNAWIMGEINMDPSVVLRLLEMYNHVCPQPDFEKGYAKNRQDAYWARTLKNTKKHYIELLTEAVESKPSMMPFTQFWVEAQSFVKDDTGKMEAEGKRRDPSVKNYDDCIMAGAMTILGHYHSPKPTESKMPVTTTDRERKKWQERLGNPVQSAVDLVPKGLDRGRVL